MSKGPNFLFEIERSSRQRVVEIEKVHCIVKTDIIKKIYGRLRWKSTFFVNEYILIAYFQWFKLCQHILGFINFGLT